MNDIHKLDILPDNNALISVAAFENTFGSNTKSYRDQLKEMQSTMEQTGFFISQDATEWVRERGRDYLQNPKLFENAPLTYVCTLLSELFKTKSVDEISISVQPATLNTLLKRLNAFKLH